MYAVVMMMIMIMPVIAIVVILFSDKGRGDRRGNQGVGEAV